MFCFGRSFFIVFVNYIRWSRNYMLRDVNYEVPNARDLLLIVCKLSLKFHNFGVNLIPDNFPLLRLFLQNTIYMSISRQEKKCSQLLGVCQGSSVFS